MCIRDRRDLCCLFNAGDVCTGGAFADQRYVRPHSIGSDIGASEPNLLLNGEAEGNIVLIAVFHQLQQHITSKPVVQSLSLDASVSKFLALGVKSHGIT